MRCLAAHRSMPPKAYAPEMAESARIYVYRLACSNQRMYVTHATHAWARVRCCFAQISICVRLARVSTESTAHERATDARARCTRRRSEPFVCAHACMLRARLRAEKYARTHTHNTQSVCVCAVFVAIERARYAHKMCVSKQNTTEDDERKTHSHNMPNGLVY